MSVSLVVIVLCSALVFAIVVGIFVVKAAHARTDQDVQDLESQEELLLRENVMRLLTTGLGWEGF